jgi:hypothetical protein
MTHEEMYDDPVLREAGLVVRRHHEWLGEFDHVGLGAHLSVTPASLGDPPPLIGSDTVRLLKGHLGYDDTYVESLLIRGVVDSHLAPSARNNQLLRRVPPGAHLTLPIKRQDTYEAWG